MIHLTVVENELAAEILCGRLRADGIDCDYRPTALAGAMTAYLAGGGPMEILVDERRLEDAKKVIDS
jgi:Putative prokaryotic signal transducing protein